MLESEKFFNASPDPTALISIDGLLIGCNTRFERTIGNASMLKGLDFLQNCIHNEDHTRFRLAMERVQEVQQNVEDESADTATGDASDMREWMRIPSVRNCRTLALGTKGDFPVWRKLDWALTSLDETTLILTARLAKIGSDDAEKNNDNAPSERELLDFLNKAPIAMHWLSGTGHVLWANETEMNTLGYTPEEYIGQPIMNFCPDEKDLVLEIFKTLGSGNSIKDTPVRFRTKGGDIRDLLIDSNVNWNPDGSFKHTRCFIRDDTARKVREARLTVAIEKDREVLRAKDVFFRRIFHEIRTPCHKLVAHTDAIEAFVQETKSEGEAQDLTKQLRGLTGQLQRLVEDAADASLFNLGKMPIARSSPFNLRDLVLSVCAELKPALKPDTVAQITYASGTQRCTTDWEGAVQVFGSNQDLVFPDALCGDSQVLRRVLRHLVSLAIERGAASRPSRIDIQATFWPASGDAPSRVSFAVHDTGPAVDEREVAESFHHYFHAPVDEADVPVPAGNLDLRRSNQLTNLGLYVSFNLAQALGGSLTCEHAPGGSEAESVNSFTFTIPLELAEASAHAGSELQEKFNELHVVRRLSDDDFMWDDLGFSEMASKTAEIASGPTEEAPEKPPAVGIEAEMKRNPSVLLADPSSVNQKVVGAMLRKLNCTVEVVADGAKCMERLASNIDCYDVVIIDPNLPIVDGFEVTRQLRSSASPQAAKLPVLALISKEMKAQLAAGTVVSVFHAELTKPLKKDELQGALDSALALSSAPACAAPASAAPAAAEVPSSPLPPATSQWTCLVVEDDKVCQVVAVKMMKRMGFTCETADNGQIALTMLREKPDRAKLVLMDLRMPVMDGLEATRLIREDERFKDLTVVALTSELIDKSWSQGFSGMLNKPATPPLLKAEVQRLFPDFKPAK